MKKIIRAENAGFCFGVENAVNMAFQKAKEKTQGRVYSLGPLIHNESVVKELESAGVKVISSLKQAKPGDVVIIRSHGVGKQVYQQAAAMGMVLEDATCPFVKKVQDIVRSQWEKGRQIIIAGDISHPEVQGLLGWCENRGFVVGSAKEALALLEKDMAAPFLGDGPALVAQTTLREAVYEEISDILKKSKENLEIFPTICHATRLRQESCQDTAKRCDAMIVIGGKNSSNSQKLYEIAKINCPLTFFVQTKEDLPLPAVEKCNTIGITAGASTPECIIKEVIAAMSEIITDGQEQNEMLAFMDDIEKSLRMPSRGEIVNGEIISVSDREIVVNLGCKKDGIIPKEEVTLEPGQTLTELFHAGESIEAKVLKTKDDDGNILLSKKKLEINEHWNEVNEALEDKTVINVKVTGKVRGGVIASFKEISGFIPLSQLSDKFTEDVDEYIGKTIPVKVIQTNPKRNRAVFSHRAVLMEEKAKRSEALWNSIHVDDIVDGVVKRFTDYGAFVDIGGVDGLLHISEISWGKIKKPQDVLELEQKIKVKILSMNQEKGKISLGLKQTTPEPWENIDEKFKEGDVIQGKVVQLKDYGAFIEIEPGLDGLVHISEIAFKRVSSPANELEIGQVVNAKILDIDKEKRRISLSIKETLDRNEEEASAQKAEEPAEQEAPEEASAEE